MDSKIVGRELWRVVRPLLKEAGWTSFTSRTARAFFESRINVINFQSFNSYIASVIGITTYSFSIKLGCFLRVIPNITVKFRDGLPMPEEYECHLRSTLPRKFSQPECARNDVFYVDPKGEYLPLVVQAAREAITKQGFQWFQRFSDMREVLRTLLEDDETDEVAWGFGANPSPARFLYRGYVALSLGDNSLASNDLNQALSSSRFEQLRQQIQSDLSRMSRS